jgi:hypothetical protein
LYNDNANNTLFKISPPFFALLEANMLVNYNIDGTSL